jgi:hypothetical protein
MDAKTIDKVELELVSVSLEIGLIHESNSHYTAGLAQIIAGFGTPVQDMTVGALLAMHRQYSEAFNRQREEVDAIMRSTTVSK